MTEIGESAFRYCSSLTSITIPEGVTTIEEEAFAGCSSLTSITIPEGVTEIGKSAFEDCTGELIINSKFIENDFNIVGMRPTDEGSWLYESQFTKLISGKNVPRIGRFAFYNYSSLTSVTISESVTEIRMGAFYALENGREMYCKSVVPPALEVATAIFFLHDYKIYVPRESVEAYKMAPAWESKAARIVGYDF